MESASILPARLLCLDIRCDLEAVRDACRLAREFLLREALDPGEVDAWELALAETANNAVNYAPPARRNRPLRLDLHVLPGSVEMRVTDHTDGFEFPEKSELPPDDSESGRGLFLIQALTDEALYLRGRNENCLILRKNRSGLQVPPSPGPAAEPPWEQDESLRTLELMTEELSSCYEILAAIFRFSAEMQGGAQSEGFARRWLAQLLTITGADWYVLRLATPAGRRLEIAATSEPQFGAGSIPCDPPAGEAPFVEQRAAAGRVDVWFDETTARSPGDPLDGLGRPVTGLAHPIYVNDNLVGVLTVGRNGGNRPFDAGQANVIQTFGDFLGIQIRNALFQEEQSRARLDARDLEIAATIQKSLLPESLPQPCGARLTAHYRSARQVGGDYYDAVATADGNLFLVVADVMGKGLPAAMFAAIFRSLVRSRPDLTSRPGEFLTWLNHNLADELGRVEMFITAQLVFVNLRANELAVSSAGHPPLLLADHGGVREIEKAGLPVGIQNAEAYSTHRFPLPMDFRLLLYTDGLTEARDRRGSFLGVDQLKQWLDESFRRHEEIGAAKRRLVGLLDDFEKDVQPADDKAFILVARDSNQTTPL